MKAEMKSDKESTPSVKFEKSGDWGFEGWDNMMQAYTLVGPFRTYSISIVTSEDGEALLKDLTSGSELGVFKSYYDAREVAWDREDKILSQYELLANTYGHKLDALKFMEPKKSDQEILADKIWSLLKESLADLKPWAVQALANYDREFILYKLPIKLKNFCNTQRDALLCAFDHSQSPEGYEYWENILWPKEQWFKEWPDSPLPG